MIKIKFKDGREEQFEDLREADLRGADLSGANLRGADLSGANLRGANLYRANLSGANLYRANLYGADLYGADLYRANLYRANLSDNDLRGTGIIKIQSERRVCFIDTKNKMFRCGCFYDTISNFLMKNAQEHPTEYLYETMIMRNILRKEAANEN